MTEPNIETKIPETVTRTVLKNFAANPTYGRAVLRRLHHEEDGTWWFHHRGLVHRVTPAGQISIDSVHQECTKPAKTGRKRDGSTPYKQEVGGSSPSPPTIKSIACDGLANAQNPRLAQLARDFVHLLCTSGLHGSFTIYPAPTRGRCQVCDVWFGANGSHTATPDGLLLAARCHAHAGDRAESALHAVIVRFPADSQSVQESKPVQADIKAEVAPCS